MQWIKIKRMTAGQEVAKDTFLVQSMKIHSKMYLPGNNMFL